MRIDAHQHFWRYTPERDTWITSEMSVLQQDYLPADLHPLLQEFDFDGCVAVQSDQSELENEFHLLHAEANDFNRGIVGWVDLQASGLEERLEYYKVFKKIKGFRHVLQGETDRALMLQPAFKKGIGLLGKHDFTYDILVYPDQLVHINELVAAFPNQRFVIDHLAKPLIRTGEITAWETEMRQLAAYPQVYCKVSGMVTEADWDNWSAATLAPYLDVVANAFGPKRLMFGSDWPVCLLAASYEQVVEVATAYFATFSETERQDVFGNTAARFYRL